MRLSSWIFSRVSLAAVAAIVAPLACDVAPPREDVGTGQSRLIGATGDTLESVVHILGCSDGEGGKDCFGDGAQAKGIVNWDATGIAFGAQCLMTATHVTKGPKRVGKAQPRLLAYAHADAVRNTGGVWEPTAKATKNRVASVVHKFGEIPDPPKDAEGQPEIIVLKMTDPWAKAVAAKAISSSSDLAARLPGKGDYVLAYGFGWDNVPGKEKQESEGSVALPAAPYGEATTAFLTAALKDKGQVVAGGAKGDSGAPVFLLKKAKDDEYVTAGLAGITSAGSPNGVGVHASVSAAFEKLTAKERAAIASACDWKDEASSSTGTTVASSSGGGDGGGSANGAGGFGGGISRGGVGGDASFGGGGFGFGWGGSDTGGAPGAGGAGGTGGLATSTSGASSGAGGAFGGGASNGGASNGGASNGGASLSSSSSSSGGSGGAGPGGKGAGGGLIKVVRF